MTREVLICISGTQMLSEESENVGVVTTGEYFYKNNTHYVLYEEVMEGFSGPTKNMVKIRTDYLEIIKKGEVRTSMVFSPNKKNISSYMTPFGELMIGIQTRQITIAEQPERLNIMVDYALDINYDHMSDCSITMEIQSKATADLGLLHERQGC